MTTAVGLASDSSRSLLLPPSSSNRGFPLMKRSTGPEGALVYERVPPRFFESIRQRYIAYVAAGKALAVHRTV